MSYEVTKTIAEETTDTQHGLIQLVKLDRKHTAADFEQQTYVDVDTFRFESGWVRLDDTTKVEVTRLIMSCSDAHDHGVYYQAPRVMELWEVMFAIGETNGPEVKEEVKE